MDAVIGFFLAFLGALAGGFITRVVLRARYGLARREVAANANQLLNLFQALHTELSLTWQAYQNLAGDALEQASEPDGLNFPGFFTASQHYFSIYDTAAAQLGALEPASCRRLIDAYVNLKAYFDELHLFRRLADRQREVRLKADINLYEARPNPGRAGNPPGLCEEAAYPGEGPGGRRFGPAPGIHLPKTAGPTFGARRL